MPATQDAPTITAQPITLPAAVVDAMSDEELERRCAGAMDVERMKAAVARCGMTSRPVPGHEELARRRDWSSRRTGRDYTGGPVTPW